MALFDTEVVRRRRAIICCVRAQSRFRSALSKMFEEILSQLADLPLEAGGLLPVAVLRTPVRVKLPITSPGRGVAVALPGLDPRFSPETLPLALSRTDGQIITGLKFLVDSTPTIFDCERCNKPLSQDKGRERMLVIDQDGQEMEQSQRRDRGVPPSHLR